MSAVLFGSIGVIADTSERQRQAFNQAFEAHGLPWQWSQDDYRAMLATSGGEHRIAEYARSVGTTVDAAAVHRSKSEIFRRNLAASGVTPRPGVVETIRGARSHGSKVALVTTTSHDNIAALIEALRPEVEMTDFDLVVDASSVGQPKPDKAAYSFALDRLGERPGDCVAIEDNVGGVEAAVAGGVPCVAFPSENNVGHDFGKAHHRVERLDFDELRPGHLA